MCLVNDAVYIAKYANGKHAGEWTAVGTQFQVPYVFKTLFSKEKIEFKDMCETKTSQTQIYLDFNEDIPEDEHNYVFVGKVGLFTPVLPGQGGGILLWKKNEKYYAVTGTKGYRWVESETLKNNDKIIDKSYYENMVDDAVKSIDKYVDANWFISDEPYNGTVPFK